MATKAKATATDPRSDMEKLVSGIEHDREWKCYWQHKTPGDRRLVEYMFYPRAKTMLLVVKDFDGAIRTGRPWPKMVSYEVFAPIGGNTFAELGTALDQLEANAK